MPTFSLDPEKLRHKLGPNPDINFTDSPRFSRSYLVRGEDEARIRETLTKPVRHFLERRPGRCIRSYGTQLVYYRPVRLLKWSVFRPGPAEHLLNEGIKLLSLLRDRARGRAC